MKMEISFHVDRTSVNTMNRLEIFHKIYTNQFSGERILHTENA